MSLLTASIAKNSRTLHGICFKFLKKVLTKLESLSIPNLDLSEKNSKSSYQVRQDLPLFSKLIVLSLG